MPTRPSSIPLGLTRITRRQFLCRTTLTLGSPAIAAVLSSCGGGSTGEGQRFDCVANTLAPVADPESAITDFGPLGPVNADGLRLPGGFTSRIIARSGQRAYPSSPYLWHSAPDGGAIFATDDGGWIYVSNSELPSKLGGVGAVRFDPMGDVVASYSILQGTTSNCAGGATPWKTWLSCEEYERGTVWECDPYGIVPAVQRPALGTFAHEAVAVDTINKKLYLTEDRSDGCLYRFSPNRLAGDGSYDLSSGVLEVAVVNTSSCRVSWVEIPDPSASLTPTRYQVIQSTPFNGGEGIVFFGETVFFATKGDNRIWSYDTKNETIGILYDPSTHPNPILSGVDNVAVSRDGELLIAEDGGDQRIVAVTAGNKLVPVVQLEGHDRSEVTGPAFTPDGTRLIFSSQRGTSGLDSDGMTFEISGPFLKPP